MSTATKTLKLPFLRLNCTKAEEFARLHSAAPTLGQHSEEILQTLGYSTTEIAALREAQVI